MLTSGGRQVAALWQPRAHSGAGLMGEPVSLCRSELLTDDVGAATAFYGAVLGWEYRTAGPPYTVAYQDSEHAVAGIVQRPPDQGSRHTAALAVLFRSATA